MFCFCVQVLQLVFVVELCNTHFRQYHSFQFVWVFTFFDILYFWLCILDQIVIVWLVKKWCWKKCCSTKSYTSHMSISFCWRWNYIVKPACNGTARDHIFFSVAGRFPSIQVLEFELKDFVYMTHIFLYIVYNVWHGLTTLYTLFIINSSAVKFYACELTENLDFLALLLSCKLCQQSRIILI